MGNLYKADRLCLYLPVTVNSGVAHKITGSNDPHYQELQNNAFLERLNIHFLPLHLLEQVTFARSTGLVESYLSY